MTTPSPSDEPAFRIELEHPIPATWALVTLLIAVHLLSGLVGLHRVTAAEALLFDRPAWLRIAAGGQSAELVDAGQVWRLATSVLLHVSALHLVLNAMGLIALGRLLEPAVGGRRLLGWFAMGGTLASVASHIAGMAQSDGASGGAFAWLGAALALGLRHRNQLDPRDAQVLGPGLLGLTLLNFVLSLAVPAIDAVAHFGGWAVGVLLGFVARDGRYAKGFVAGAFLVVCVWGWTVRSP